jgi:hypothetical protein
LKPVIQSGRQISPARVRLQNQVELLRPRPTLQLLLARDRIIGEFESRMPHEHVAVIALGEIAAKSEAVLADAPRQIVRDADVERARDVAEDVDVVVHQSG